MVLTPRMRDDVDLAARYLGISRNEVIRRAIEGSQTVRDASRAARRMGLGKTQAELEQEAREMTLADRIRIGRVSRDAIQPRPVASGE